MAAIAATILENAILMVRDRFMKFEKRRPDLGVVAAYNKYSDQLIDAATIANNRKSAGRATYMPVLNRQVTPIRNQRSINISPVGSNSAKVGMTWNTYGFDVGIISAVNADNYITETADLANQLEQGIRDVLKQMDVDFSANLELGKYSALPPSTLMSISGGAYKSTTTDIFFNLPAVMRVLELEGPYHMISNPEALANRTRISTMGENNNQNLQTLMKGYEFGYTKNVSAGSSQEVYYAVPTGSLGMVSWIEYDCRVGKGSYDSNTFYGSMTLEFTDLGGNAFSLEFGFLYKGEPTDASAIRPGLERAWADKWSLFVDVSPVKAYSSEAGKSPIVKFLADKPGAPAA